MKIESRCSHSRKTLAADVTVFIDEWGCLRGGEGYMDPSGKWRKPGSPLRYSRVLFCSNPGCEKVFENER